MNPDFWNTPMGLVDPDALAGTEIGKEWQYRKVSNISRTLVGN